MALGVAVVISIDLANGSARRGFERSTETVTGRATHQVLGGPSGVHQDLFRQIRVEAGLRTSTPVVEGYAITQGLDRQPLRVLGLDPLSDAPFRAHLGGGSLAEPGFARDLRRPARGGGRRSPGAALRSAARLAAEASPCRTASRRSWSAGIAHAAAAEEDSALESVVLMDVGAAQKLFGLGDRVTRIDLIAGEGELERVRAVLPPGARLAPASEQAATVGQLTEAFQLNLTALSLLALVVGHVPDLQHRPLRRRAAPRGPRDPSPAGRRRRARCSRWC